VDSTRAEIILFVATLKLLEKDLKMNSIYFFNLDITLRAIGGGYILS